MAQTRKQVRRTQQTEAQTRNAAARAEAARAERRRKTLTRGGIVVGGAALVTAVAVPLIVHATGGGSGVPHPTITGREDPPPWAAPAHPVPAAKAAGLRVNAMEGSAEHFHAHLDVLVDGKPVTVPADIGIDTASSQLSELHTHDATGVLHVEAPDKKHKFSLGQLFAEWDVRLDRDHLGGLAAGNGSALRVYVDGAQVGTDPAHVELKPHEEIALVFGPSNAKVDVPKSYHFAEGE